MDIEATRGTLIPPQQFIDAARLVAQSLSVDADLVISGCPIRHHGVECWLHHYGQADPDGMVLMIDICRLPPESEPQVLRALMEYQYVAPVGVTGYCVIMPGTDLLAYCTRIDFERTPDAAGEILRLMANAAEIRDDFAALLAMHQGPPRAPRTANSSRSPEEPALLN